jgi:serine protease Do
VILKLNGSPLKDSSELPVQIAAVAPGTSVTLEIWRNHATREVAVKLGAMEEQRTAANAGPHKEGGKLGLAVRPLTADEQRGANMKGGLVVERVSGPAAEAGIQPGDVVLAANGSPLNNADELRSAVEKSKGHIALLIQRGDTRLFVPVRVS